MTRALSVMRHEQRRLHWEFYMGLFFFHLATGSFCMGLFYDHDKVTAFMCVGTLLLSFTWLCLDCRSVAQQLWLPPAASLWRGEVDRRPANQQKSVRYSCTGAVVGVPGTGQHATAAQQHFPVDGRRARALHEMAPRRRRCRATGSPKRLSPSDLAS